MFAPRFNIAPTQPILTIGLKADLKTWGPAMFNWGLIPSWSNDAKGLRPVNAKSETLTEKPMFKELFRKRRCLIPASGYYEWETQGKKKIPHFIHRKDGGLITFAGLWDCWSSGSEKIFSCTIVTTSSNDLTRHLHERMPVILPREVHREWANPAINDTGLLKSLLKPCPDDELAIRPANPLVNKAAYDAPDCLEPGPANRDLFGG